MPRHRASILLLSLTTLACAGRPQSAPLPRPSQVWLVQVDGLTPATLRDYLGRPASRAADRALHRELGASAPGGGEIEFGRAATGTLVAPLPTRSAPGTATLLTGVWPAEHGVRAPDDAIDPKVPTILEATPSAAVDLPVQRGARAVALEAVPPDARLVAVRFDIDEGLDAIDRRLATALAAAPADRVLVLTAGHGRRTLGELTAQGPAAFAGLLEVKAETLHASGGLLRVEALLSEKAAALDALDFTAAVFQITEQGVAVFDADLGRTRSLDPGEFAAWPRLAERLRGLARPGEWVAVAAEGYRFAEQSETHGTGGPHADASVVPLLVAGAGLGGDLGEHPATAVAPLLRALLGGGDGGALAREVRRGPVAPAGGDWARCAEERAACERVVAHTDHPAAARAALHRLGSALADRPLVWRAVADGRVLELPADTPPPHAALLARVHGADAAALGDEAVAPTPLLGDLGGPHWLRGPLQSTAKLGRGARLFSAGLRPDAIEALEGVEGPWAQLLRAWAIRRAPGEYPAVELPGPASAEVGFVAAVVRALNPVDDEDAPPMPAPRGRGPLAEALHSVFGGAGADFCALTEANTWAQRLDGAASTLAERRPGLAALLRVRRMPFLPPQQAAAEAHRAIALAARPRAAWIRHSVALELLLHLMVRPANARAAVVEGDAAARMLLLDLQRDIAADHLPGAEERQVARLAGLTHGLASRAPALLRETIDLGVGGRADAPAAVVQAVLLEGGVMSLLSGDGHRKLTSMLRVVEQALAPVRDLPLEKLSADDRVARVAPHLIGALLAVFEGRMPDAQTELARADRLLDLDLLLPARAEALAGLSEEDDAPLVAWAPYLAALVDAGRTVVAGLSGDAAGARTHVDALVKTARGFARHELRRVGLGGALDAHVDAWAALLGRLAGLGFALVSDDASALEGALADAAEAAKALPLEAPPGEAAEVGRWFVVAAVLVRDGVALYRALPRGEPPADLGPVDAAVQRLVAEWTPESGFLRGGLMLLQAGQRMLPEIPALMKQLDEPKGWLGALTKIDDAVRRFVASVRAEWPRARVAEALAAGERVDLLALDLGLHLLEVPRADLFAPKATANLVLARMAELEKSLPRQPSDVRAMLALAHAWLARAEERHDEALAAIEAGRRFTPGTALAPYRFLWDVVAVAVHRAAGDADRVEAALAAAALACPPAASATHAARGLHLGNAGQGAAARTAFAAARRAARARNLGPLAAKFALEIRDQHDVAQMNLDLQVLSLMLGHAGGSFQLGAGKATGEQDTRKISWTVESIGTPVDVAVETLTHEAWISLRAGDEAAADRALARLTGLWMGLDPRHLDGPEQAPALPDTGVQRLRAPLELTWVAVLAELRGHRELGGWLLARIAEAAQREWQSSPYGQRSSCEDEVDELGHEMVSGTTCQAPSALVEGLDEAAVEALSRVVHLRVRALHEDQPPPADAWATALKAAAAAAPSLLPGWTVADGAPPAVIGVARLRGGDAGGFEAARERYPCEAAMLGLNLGVPPEKVADAARGCGPTAILLQALLTAAQKDLAWPMVAEAIEVADRLTVVRAQALEAAWPMARAAVEARPEHALAAAKLATALGAEKHAVWFRAFELSRRLETKKPPTPEAARQLLRDAREAGADDAPLKSLKAWLYDEGPVNRRSGD